LGKNPKVSIETTFCIEGDNLTVQFVEDKLGLRGTRGLKGGGILEGSDWNEAGIPGEGWC